MSYFTAGFPSWVLMRAPDWGSRLQNSQGSGLIKKILQLTAQSLGEVETVIYTKVEHVSYYRNEQSRGLNLALKQDNNCEDRYLYFPNLLSRP